MDAFDGGLLTRYSGVDATGAALGAALVSREIQSVLMADEERSVLNECVFITAV